MLLMAVVVALAVALFFGWTRRESRWRVAFDFRKWRVYASETAEFDPTGTLLRSRKAYHVGPVVVSKQNEHASWPSANGLQVGRRTSSISTLRRRSTLEETIAVEGKQNRGGAVGIAGTNVLAQP